MNKEKTDKTIGLKTLIIIVICIWIISGIICWFFFKDWSKSGSFGDTFGAVNSLFSGLALAGIIYTIYLQKTELSLQRKELEYTREELSRTADAQENTTKIMNEQIRLNNLPFLQYSSNITNGKECLIISNQSENPAFDVDIWLFVAESEDNYPRKDFINDWVIEDDKKFIEIGDFVDGEIWSISERAVYNSFPKNKKIIIPFDYPISNDVFEIYIQHRDNLGNNYSQNIYFMSNDSINNPFYEIGSNPNFPTVTKRIELTDETLKENMLPEVAKGIVDTKNASIYGSRLKNRGKIGVENFWEMKDI